MVGNRFFPCRTAIKHKLATQALPEIDIRRPSHRAVIVRIVRAAAALIQGVHVDRLAPAIADQELVAARESLFQLDFETIVVGVAASILIVAGGEISDWAAAAAPDAYPSG